MPAAAALYCRPEGPALRWGQEVLHQQQSSPGLPVLACWCAGEQVRLKQGALAVAMEDWADVPEARRGQRASEPAGSAQERALAAG